MSKVDPEFRCGVMRYEDMSPTGNIRLFRQFDGDVIISISGSDGMGEKSNASIEFCNVGSGGGQSTHTIEALVALIEAIKKDNEEIPQHRD